MFPTEECLEPDDAVRLELDDRLVDELELVSLEGVGELVLELEALDGGRPHGRFVDHPTRLAGRLGLVHRDVRVTQQRGGVRLRVGVGDADAGRHGDVVVAEPHRGREALQHALGDCFGLDHPAGGLLDEYGELVTAESGDRVARSRDAQDARGDLAKEAVAGLVAESVVDVLESVEVEEDHGRIGAGAGSATQRVLDPVPEQCPVRESGQRVVEGLVRQLVLGQLAVGDVVQVDDDASDVGLVEEVDRPGRQPHVGAVGVGGARLARQGHARGEQRLVEQRAGPHVVGRQEVERAVAAGPLARIAEQRGEVRCVVGDQPVGIEDEHGIRRVRGEGAVQPLARRQVLLGVVAEADESQSPGTGEADEHARGCEKGQRVGVAALGIRRPLDEPWNEKWRDRQRDACLPGLPPVLIAIAFDFVGRGVRNSAAPGGQQGRPGHPPDVEHDADETLRGGDEKREVGDQPTDARRRREASPSSSSNGARGAS